MLNLFNVGASVNTQTKNLQSIIEDSINVSNLCPASTEQSVNLTFGGKCKIKDTTISESSVNKLKCMQQNKDNTQFTNNLTDKLYSDVAAKTNGLISVGANVSKTKINELMRQTFTTDVLNKATSNIKQNVNLTCGDSAEVSGTDVALSAQQSVEQLTSTLVEAISKNSIYSDTTSKTSTGGSGSSWTDVIIYVVIFIIIIAVLGVAGKMYYDKNKKKKNLV